MKREITRYRWRCDGCQRTVESEALPAGWVQRSYEVGPCGLTNYHRTITRDLCTTCAAEAGDAGE